VTTRLAPQRPKPVTERRTCLGCDRAFWSDGDRLCKRCNTRNSASRIPPSRQSAGAPVPPGVLAALLGADAAGDRL